MSIFSDDGQDAFKAQIARQQAEEAKLRAQQEALQKQQWARTVEEMRSGEPIGTNQPPQTNQTTTLG